MVIGIVPAPTLTAFPSLPPTPAGLIKGPEPLERRSGVGKGPGQLCLAQHAISDPKRSQGIRAKGSIRRDFSLSNALR